MKQNINSHPDESLLLAAVVDKNALSEDAKKHLTGCAACSEKFKSFEVALTALGDTARELAPAPTRRPQLPKVRQKVVFWRPALAAAFTIAVVTWGVWWTFDPPKPKSPVTEPEFALEVWEDDAFMAEVSSLSKNALPDDVAGLLEVFDLPENKGSEQRQDSFDETQSYKGPAMKGIPIC